MSPRTLIRLDRLAYRCTNCGGWRLPERYMRRHHRCIPDDYEGATR